MSDYDECIKAVHKFHEDVIKGYLEKPNQKLDESIRKLTDEEFFLLSMLVLFDFGGRRMTNRELIKCLLDARLDNFEMWRDEEEYYIKYLPSGVTINWYKGAHLGRTNTCTDPNFTLDDFEKFLVQLKRDICGGEND